MGSLTLVSDHGTQSPQSDLAGFFFLFNFFLSVDTSTDVQSTISMCDYLFSGRFSMPGAAFTSNTFLIKEFLLMYQLCEMKKIPDFFTLFGLTTPVPSVRFLAFESASSKCCT